MGVGLGSGASDGVLFAGLEDGALLELPEGDDDGLGEGVEQAASSSAAAIASAPRLNACCRCGRG